MVFIAKDFYRLIIYYIVYNQYTFTDPALVTNLIRGWIVGLMKQNVQDMN